MISFSYVITFFQSINMISDSSMPMSLTAFWNISLSSGAKSGFLAAGEKGAGVCWVRVQQMGAGQVGMWDVGGCPRVRPSGGGDQGC